MSNANIREFADLPVARVKLKRVQIKPDWKPHVTFHAQIRYVERVLNVDMQEVLDAMQTDAVKRAIVFGAGSVKLSNGAKICIENGKVVTVLTANMRPKRVNIVQSKRAERLAQEIEA